MKQYNQKRVMSREDQIQFQCFRGCVVWATFRFCSLFPCPLFPLSRCNGQRDACWDAGKNMHKVSSLLNMYSYRKDHRSSDYSSRSHRKRKHEFDQPLNHYPRRNSRNFDSNHCKRRPRSPSSSYSQSSIDDDVGHYQGNAGNVIKNRCQCIQPNICLVWFV